MDALIRWPIQPMEYETLKAASYPLSAGIPETLPWWFYDSQEYPAAGIRQLQFFQAVANDQTLSNWFRAGTLPDPQFFAIYTMFLDVFSLNQPYVTSAAAPAGVVDDIGSILFQARGTYTVTLSGKDYGPFPLRSLPQLGGVAAELGPLAAANTIQQGGNFGRSGWWGGSLIIPPVTDFRITVNFQQTLIPVSVDYVLQITMGGTLYRAVK